MEITTDSNLDNFIKCEPYIELTNGSSITINSDGINLIGATPNTPQPIKFPTLGEWDLYNSKHDGYDFGIEIKKEGENMKLLNMYVEKSEKNIKDYYEKLLNEEYNNREVVKEFEDLCNKFQEDLAKLAEKTANEKIRLIDLEYEVFESGYGIECNPTEEEQEIKEKLSEELRNLHDKIDEVNAQLEIITNDENSSHHDINYVLHNYGIIDENNKLTPYTPTFVGKEAPKKAGRPKKVSE